MTTIHIKGIGLKDGTLQRLYKDILKIDPLFHYVYWENGTTHKATIGGKNIIIRLNDKKAIDKLTEWLDGKEIFYDRYSYPFTRKKFQLGLKRKSWEDRHFDISLGLDHLCSRAALELNTKDWESFLTQLIHIACNTRGINFFEQCLLITRILHGSLRVVYDQSRNKFTK